MPNDINRDKSIRRAKTVTQLIICAAVAAVGGYYIKGAYDNARIVPASHYVDASGGADIDIPDANDLIDPDALIYNTVPVPTKDKFYGDLILVNNDNQYFSSGDEDLVSIMDMNDEAGINCFIAVDYDYTILRKVYEPMAKMVCDFYDIYNNDTLIIYGSFRTREFQEQLYEEFISSDDDEAPLVAKPGFSEHESGYAFDFSETVNYDYQGDGDFAWINENCYKYGFIERYTEEKESITEIRPEPWHFRYVGVPHAYYMTKNNLCLEEYIDLLRESYAYEGEHLKFSDHNGKNYEVYFFPSDDGADTTNVPVPNGCKYEISGNNVDGFIVTVYTDEEAQLGQTAPEADNVDDTDDADAEPTDDVAE